jgi:hypothetical protein
VSGIVAFWEKPSMTSDGVLRKEFRVRPLAAFASGEHIAFFNGLRRSNPFAQYVLETRYLRDGVDEGWQPFDGYQTRVQALEDVDGQATAVDRGVAFLQQKRTQVAQRERLRVAEAARLRMEADDRRYHAERSQAAFVKLAAAHPELTDRWQRFVQHASTELKDRIQADRGLYDDVMTAETMPAKAKALKAFFARWDSVAGKRRHAKVQRPSRLSALVVDLNRLVRS